MTNPSVFDGPVVIVGGGVAGLVSAHLLQEAGVQTIVIEKHHEVGGLARSYEYDGFVFDIGPHRFHTANPNIKAYLDRTLKGNGTFFPRKSEVFFKEKYYRWPLQPRNLTQLPPDLMLKASIDLALNGLKHYNIDSFETYILRQYGPTLYKHFFEGYSEKFLGIHPKETHPDWAKTGINRAIIDDKLQMHNLTQLVKSTFLQFNKSDPHFLYPTHGMHEAWTTISKLLLQAGGRIITGQGARIEGSKDGTKIERVWAGDESFEPSAVVWTAPITLATKQLKLDQPQLDYLGLLLFNVCVDYDVPRDYQWCYYGQSDIVFNRVSIPRFFSDATVPRGGTGLCIEVTCMEGDARWLHAERLTNWVVDDLIKVGMIPNRRVIHDVYIERIPESYPIYHKNYPGELEKARNQLVKYTNFHPAGRTGMFWYNNMDHSIQNAIQLVKRLLRDAGQSVVELDLAQGLAS